MGELIWLLLLAPLGAALASWRQPEPHPAITALGALATAAGAVGLLAGVGGAVSFQWLPRNGSSLVDFSLTGTPLAGAVLLSLLAAAGAEGLTARRWLALSAAALSLLSEEVVLAFAGLSLAALATTRAPRAQWSHRLSDIVAILGMGALYHHVAAFGWGVPLLPDSPQTVLICALLVAGLGGYLGVLPWPAARHGVAPIALAGFLLVRMAPLLSDAAPVLAAAGAVAALSLAFLGTTGAIRAAWPPLLVTLAAVGATDLLTIAVLAWPILAAARGRLALLLSAAVLAGVPLAGWIEAGRWLPAMLLAAAVLLLGTAAPRPERRDAIGGALALVVGAAAIAAGLTDVPSGPLWGPLVTLPLVGVGVMARASASPIPRLDGDRGWMQAWQAIRQASRQAAALRPPRVSLPATLWQKVPSLGPGDHLFLLAFAAIVLLAYAVGVSR